MTNNDWYRLIKENEEEIQECGEKAYAGAMHNPHLEYRVEKAIL